MSATITTRVENKVLSEIDAIAKEKNMDRATMLRNLIQIGLIEEKKELVLRKYKKGKISLGRAAEELNMSILDMIEIIKEQGLYLNYGKEQLKEDLKGLG